MRQMRLHGRLRAWLAFGYHVVNNIRVALRNAILGERYAEIRRLERRGQYVRGPHTYGWPQVLVFERGTERLVAGNYCSLNGIWVLGGQHAVDRLTTFPHRIRWHLDGAGTDGFPTPRGDTIVGSDVWVAAEALIMSGIEIGDGAIVGGGAVVTRNVPPYAIVGGNPAKIIRYRFTEEQVAALLEIRWWDWPDDEVRAALPLLTERDVDAFIAYALARPASAGPGTAD